MSEQLHYHLIGIGGAGMSAIARILHERGASVTGSDRSESDSVRRLRASGIKVSIGHDAANVNGADVVVYTAAVTQENPEIVEARRKGVTLLERPAMLGKLMQPYKHRIAVSGTHGKTTTTSMIDGILDRAGLDGTSLVGGDLKSLGGNARIGKSEIILAEACEAFESFLHLYPSMAVITNIDADHLDYYKTIERIEESFSHFVSQVDERGCVIACWDDERVRRVIGACGRRIVKFGLCDGLDVSATDVDINSPNPSYTLMRAGEPMGRVTVGVPGIQNVIDSLAAAAVAFEMGVDFDSIADALSEFTGAGRRFEILYNGDVMVVDDYAHHPAEVDATLSGTRAAYDRNLIAVFQPHLYSRTKAFTNEFADALNVADEVIVTSIYAARELPIEGVSAEGIVERLKSLGHTNVSYWPERETLAAELAKRAKSGDLILCLGAGDIRSTSEELAKIMSEGGN